MSCPRRLALAAGCLAFAASLLVGCGRSESEVQIEDVRERERPRQAVRPDATTAERFNVSAARGQLPPDHPPMTPQRRWRWNVPEGWEELPPKPMRDAGFRVAGREDTECTFTVMSGPGGGLTANVNRWCKQMSLPALDDEAVAALPTKPLLGQTATYVDLEGAYRGMGSEVAIEKARLLGLVLALPRVSVFVKLVGPAEVVAQERERFEAFAGSIAPASRRPPSKFKWTVPDGWTKKPDRAMREVTISPPDSKETECYVAVLGGRAGGIAANVNRWLAQLGQPALDAAGVADLRRVPMLGGEGVMVAATGGRFTGQAGEQVEAAMLLGVVLERPDESVFVKMTGPESEVRPHLEAFVAFCRSLAE